MLTDHLQREAVDFEACNLLLQCFYQTERYEIGEHLAETVMAQGAANNCFENNRFCAVCFRVSIRATFWKITTRVL